MKRAPSRLVAARRLLAFFAALCAYSISAPCGAHAVGVSRGVYRRVASGLDVSLTFAQSELASLGDEARVVSRIEVRSTTPCRGELTGRQLLAGDGVSLALRFVCSAGPIRVSLAPLLSELTRGHRHEAEVLPRQTTTLLYGARPELVVEEGSGGPALEPGSREAPGSLGGFVRLGVEHVLSGYDHLVFLLGLVVVGLGTRRTLLVASAFTLAHSMTLVVSAFGWWSPPTSLVEPAIALSIVYVGVENLVARPRGRRLPLAFGFGLVHGFGFASALAGVHFRGLALVGALGAFNLGIELGQLAVLALSLPCINLLLARPLAARYAVRGVSALVAASGVVWFVERLQPLS